MRIAVIGSGIAGLSAAWLLSRSEDNTHALGRNQVTIFEKSSRLG
jgi:predicted NAD/FAD-binding protein